MDVSQNIPIWEVGYAGGNALISSQINGTTKMMGNQYVVLVMIPIVMRAVYQVTPVVTAIQ